MLVKRHTSLYVLCTFMYFSPPGTPSIHLPHKGGIMGDLQAVHYNCMLLWGNTKKEKRKKGGKKRTGTV